MFQPEHEEVEHKLQYLQDHVELEKVPQKLKESIQKNINLFISVQNILKDPLIF